MRPQTNAAILLIPVLCLGTACPMEHSIRSEGKDAGMYDGAMEDGAGTDAVGADASRPDVSGTDAAAMDSAGADAFTPDVTGSDTFATDAYQVNVCANEDSYEENDQLSSASAVTAPFNQTNLVGCDDDWYKLTVPARHLLRVTIAFERTEADLDLFLYEAGDSYYLESSQGALGSEEVTYLFAEETEVELLVEHQTGGAVYSMNIEVEDPCTVDDANEPNNTKGTATAITAPGLFENLVGCDDDWFLFAAPSGQVVTVTVTQESDAADLDLYIYNALDTNYSLDSSATLNTTEQLTYYDGSVTQYLVEVRNYDSNGDTVNYSLNVEFASACATEDLYEPNNVKGQAAEISAPSELHNLSSCDDDWYIFPVPASSIVAATVHRVSGEADLDLYLYNAADAENSLDRSMSTSGSDEHVEGAFAAAGQALLKVKNYSNSGSGIPKQATYNLTLTVNPIATNSYCATATELVITLDGQAVSVTGNTAGATDERETEEDCQDYFSEGKDLFYKFTTTAEMTANVMVELIASNWQGIAYVFADSCSAADDLMCTESVGAFSVEPNKTYYVVVDAEEDEAGEFQLNVRYIPQ